MIITKPHDIDLYRLDFDNQCKKTQYSKYSLSYASPEFPDDNLGFVDCKENYNHFIDCLNWLNENKMAALIEFDEYGTKKVSLPHHINPKLAAGFDGIYGETVDNLFKSLENLDKFFEELDGLNLENKTIDKTGEFWEDVTTKWMIEEFLWPDKHLVFMDSAGQFVYFNDSTIHRIVDKGISYVKHRFYQHQNYHRSNQTVEQFMGFDC